MRLFFALFILFLPALAYPADYRLATVVDVVDGDTVKLRVDGQLIEFRLAWIDAPESDQDHGEAAGRQLERYLLNREVMMIAWDQDRYNRLVGELIMMKTGESVNRYMVSECYAWYWPRFAPNDIHLAKTHDDCVRHQKGLWRNNEVCPVEPWRWRNGARRTTYCEDRRNARLQEFRRHVEEGFNN